MPTRAIVSRLLVCVYAVAIFGSASAHAQTKIYNINRPAGAEPAPAYTAPSAPAVSAQPVTQPVAQLAAQPAVSPVTQPAALLPPPRPLAASSQPPLVPRQFMFEGQPVSTLRGQPLGALAAAQQAQQAQLASALFDMAPTPPAPPVAQVAASQTAAAPAPARPTAQLAQAPLPGEDAAPPSTALSPEAQSNLQLSPGGDNPLAMRPMSYAPPVRENRSVVTMPGMQAPKMTTATRQGIELGLQASDYRYEQPDGTIKTSGTRYGGTLRGNAVFGGGLFAALEGRYSIGWLDYTGSGDLNNRTDYLWEARGLVGKDFTFEYFNLSPYSGFGYRYLNSDLNGATDTGTRLYLRENEAFYVPIGLHPRFAIDESSRFSGTFEYDFIFHGTETSHLNDRGANDPTVRNKQKDGFGFRVELMYETPYWAIGPFGNYWSVDTSDPQVFNSPSSSCGSATCTFTVPNNHTIEGGLQFKLHLF